MKRAYVRKNYRLMAHSMLPCHDHFIGCELGFIFWVMSSEAHPPSRTNPANYSTWMDEDALKKLMRVLKMTNCD